MSKRGENNLTPLKIRLKTKSYHGDTLSSIEKRTEKNRLLT